MSVALAAARGYEVVASTGRTSERDYLVGIGASEVIGRDDLVVAPERTLGPERWAGAVDCVGGPTLAAVLRTLRYGAAAAASGLTGGNTFETSVYPFIVRNVALLGVDTVRTPIEERRTVWSELADWVPGDVVDALVEGEVGLAGLAPVLDGILAGRVRGRMLVRPAARAGTRQPAADAPSGPARTGDTSSVPSGHAVSATCTVSRSKLDGGVIRRAAPVVQLRPSVGVPE
jgi:putative YhdH/YhfP family quinone oxidoreductase